MYSTNMTLLQIVKSREQWERLKGSILIERFDKEAKLVLRAVKKYWLQHDDTELNMEVFAVKFFMDNPMEDEEREFYNKIFEAMQATPNEETASGIVRELRTMEFSKEIENVQNAWVLGEDVDLFESVRGLVLEFEADIRRDADNGYCTANVMDVLRDESNGSLLEWPLDCLRRAMPGIRTGMQFIIAARPGKGKTSFCAQLAVHSFTTAFMRESGRPVLWLNNEGKKIRIKGSCIRAALNRDFDEINSMGWEAADAEYNRILGGADRLRIYDVHGKDFRYLERLLEKDKPGVVIWDMLDNVKGFSGNKNSSREDQRLESLYQWARECSVRYDFLSIPTSQISVEGADMQWVPDSCLKDSKTAKQGACDGIITIGSVNKPGFEESRFIYVPKTKLKPVMGFPSSCRTEVLFDGARSLYKDCPATPTPGAGS